MKTLIWIIILILVIIAIGYWVWEPDDSENSTLNGDGNGDGVCTFDAKLCPDGSYVGRVPPTCEFAACPGSTSTPTSTPGIDIEASTEIDY